MCIECNGPYANKFSGGCALVVNGKCDSRNTLVEAEAACHNLLSCKAITKGGAGYELRNSAVLGDSGSETSWLCPDPGTFPSLLIIWRIFHIFSFW